jgi:hypothetical protein
MTPARDESLPDKGIHFGDAIVAKLNTLLLKKVVSPGEIRYGLFDEHNLVGYLEFRQYDSTKYQVVLSQLANTFKGQGYGTFMYDYAVMSDNINLLSDARQSPSSRKLWNRFREFGRFSVVPYDTTTNTASLTADEADVYSSENLLWLATSKGVTLKEAIDRLNEYTVWYGPATIDENYFNY